MKESFLFAEHNLEEQQKRCARRKKTINKILPTQVDIFSRFLCGNERRTKFYCDENQNKTNEQRNCVSQPPLIPRVLTNIPGRS